MKNDKLITIGNITTVINTLSLMFAGLVMGILGAHGLDLHIDQYGLSGAIGIVISLIFGYVNAKYHNNFFIDEEEDTVYIPIDKLTDTQIKSINNFIENCINDNLVKINKKEYNRYNDAQIDELDPAGRYEYDKGN